MRGLTSDWQSWASCDKLQKQSLLLGIEAAQHLKQEPHGTTAERMDWVHEHVFLISIKIVRYKPPAFDGGKNSTRLLVIPHCVNICVCLHKERHLANMMPE